MEKYDLANLTIIMMNLLIEMLRKNLISYELFVKNTFIKVDFLKRFVEGSDADDTTERIMHILSQYRSCLINDYTSACNIQLSEDQFPC